MCVCGEGKGEGYVVLTVLNRLVRAGNKTCGQMLSVLIVAGVDGSLC